MNKVFFIVSICMSILVMQSMAQDKSKPAAVLSENEVNALFNASLKQKLNIAFPIFKAYHFTDKSGSFYLLLTERIKQKEDVTNQNDSIAAFCIKKSNDDFTLLWQMKDFRLLKTSSGTAENAIWFWSKYIYLQDINGDGFIEPLLVYGTSGINGIEDGRIKILLYYKNTKYAIRHQNGVLDFERNTQVDAAFYQLPQLVQNFVLDVMQQMTENNHAIFPAAYKDKMKAKKTYFNEKEN